MPAFAESLDLTVRVRSSAENRTTAARCAVDVGDVDAAQELLTSAVDRNPATAVTLAQLLRITPSLPVRQALAMESAVYSTLLASSEFRRWRRTRPPKAPRTPFEPVRLTRVRSTLEVLLDDEVRRNAYSRTMRDGLVEAMSLVLLDPTITHCDLRGAGPSFCSGGDLDEFGTVDDPVVGHLIRQVQGAGAALYEVRDRVHAHLHGWCIGAGVEIPSFAGRITASTDAHFRLPELAMGLIPGAGGTVSIPRRIGRWRTAWMALTGQAVDARTALDWGLVDALA